MPMIKAIIIDDEADARENLGNLLKKHCPDVEVAAAADSAVAGFEMIEQHKPDLVFLDIQMPGGTGIDLLEQLGDIRFEVIFVTAYDEYAIKAIKFAALDYLLKPINILELKAAVSRAGQRVAQRMFNENVRTFVDNHRSRTRKVALSTSEGVIFVEVDNIIRCEANDAYTTFHLADGDKVMISGSLKEYENLLSDNSFFRVHQSHLINLGHIKKYVKGSGGHVVMRDDSMIGIARSKKNDFLRELEAFNR